MSYFVICSPLAPGPSIQLVYPLQIGCWICLKRLKQVRWRPLTHPKPRRRRSLGVLSASETLLVGYPDLLHCDSTPLLRHPHPTIASSCLVLLILVLSPPPPTSIPSHSL
ncbi:hypothetical protein VDGL01_04153 [Verticillium dahliae]